MTRKQPEQLRKVGVLDPFLVAHDGTAYYPGDLPEVPASVADKWILNRWVTEAE